MLKANSEKWGKDSSKLIDFKDIDIGNFQFEKIKRENTRDQKKIENDSEFD